MYPSLSIRSSLETNPSLTIKEDVEKGRCHTTYEGSNMIIKSL